MDAADHIRDMTERTVNSVWKEQGCELKIVVDIMNSYKMCEISGSHCGEYEV
jgi:hypothetical protein